MLKRMQIKLEGVVQGVGARPFFYRQAKQLGLTGFVLNDRAGITLEVQGPPEKLETLLGWLENPSLCSDWPPLMQLESTQITPLAPLESEADFQILPSRTEGTPLCQITPDTAVCSQCLQELFDPSDFRYRYPFITCTQCGPRYTLIKDVPYDRPQTTMDRFAMCQRCRSQYEDMTDRRFHAQPVACAACGPSLELADSRGQVLCRESDAAVRKAADILRSGGIVAVKGIGGFHLAVDASNEDAVRRLRQRKRRQAKPFAVMVRSLEEARLCAQISEQAARLLCSPQAPIVLLPKQNPNPLASSVAAGTNTFGLMLPYAPLHHLLFAEEGIRRLVMTSANFSEEPLLYENQQALTELAEVADAFLLHNRDIFRPIDDSVLHWVDGGPAFLRRARGYVPTPLRRIRPAKKEIFAAGADLKNTFCFVKGNQYLLSEHIGDLAEGKSYRHYLRAVQQLQTLFEAEPKVVVCDLHPGYLSSQFARSLAAEQFFAVQHHWAHIASVLAEYQLEIDERVIGLAADGTGYGTDGAVWGCECLIASQIQFERFAHLAYFPLAGGDAAARQAVRPLLGLLGPQIPPQFDPILERLEPDRKKLDVLAAQIQKRVQTVPTSSLGRLFDAAAALVGLGTVNTFEAQLPMALEAAADPAETGAYTVQIDSTPEPPLTWNPKPIFLEMAEDAARGTPVSILAARFHNTVAAALLQTARKAREQTGLQTIALSGGVFCNRFLAERLIQSLKRDGFCVLWKRKVPVNDGGISLGQAAIAAAMLETKSFAE
ncbi:MAG TPA: carbamoyltransferase HypF [Anaerohalosphaeraceae bacterium]|nr:carbamoyltransferase HypF [Anaerohalosphaeraceae bacterium]HOL90018.1 carbamoyltransferase HypF [Anaerohalosphaeraceae bacterium]HPP57335.1 carbamoyltransferase HypF [Anaerohalosphaeraceae bacterium]